jgi:hypothetical protein
MMIPVLIGWIVGVPLDIWWPRKVAPEHPGLARAYSLIRASSVLLALSWTLYFVIVLLMGQLGQMGWLEALGIGLGGAAFMLSPLATCATALDAQRRWMAIFGSYSAALLAALVFWSSFSVFLLLITQFPWAPFWYAVFTATSTILSAVALFLVLELYTMVRRPAA